MRLTISIKKSIVEQILNDIPKSAKPDVEEARTVTVEYFRKRLPKDVQSIWDNPETRQYVRIHYQHVQGVGSIIVPWIPQVTGLIEERTAVGKDVDHAVKDIVEPYQNYQNLIQKVRMELTAAFYPVTTLKSFKEKFPQFAKYAPKEAEVMNLPTTTAMMDSLKLAGWENDN